jgi:KaiC/GvpD/RAD55 family RecA-like ATPase
MVVKKMDSLIVKPNLYKIERTKTGIDGVDELISGGIPKGSFVVVTGGPGSGKTILGLQFLANGAYSFNERGLYISVEMSKEEIISQAHQFGWDFEKLENDHMIEVLTLDSQRLFEIKKVNEIKNLIEDKQFDRLVLDSITSFVYSTIAPTSIADGANAGISPGTFLEMSKANVTKIIDIIKQTRITTFGLAQKIEGMPGDTVDNVSEFMGDGLIVLHYAAIGKTLNRTLQFKKLRKTKINATPHNFDFTDRGIELFKQ